MSRQNPTIARVIAIIEPACVHAGLELVDVRFVTEPGGWVLRVCIDRPWPTNADGSADMDTVPDDRVDLGTIENMSRELSALLDVDDPITQAYSLEVSSPGIDRPLRTAAHFTRFAGAEVKIVLAAPQITAAGIERRNFRGILHGMVGDNIEITLDGSPHQLPLADIDSAKIVPDWDAVMQGGSGMRPAPVGDRRPGKQPKTKPGKAGKASPQTGADAESDADQAD